MSPLKVLILPWYALNRCCFLSRNTCFRSGAVADDMGVNATSVHKAVTECHFFVKTVIAL